MPKSSELDMHHGRESGFGKVDLLATNADWVVCCDENMRCFRHGALAVEKGTLVAVGPKEHIEGKYRGRQLMDLSGFLVLPGLVNTHTHAAMSCLRGVGDDLPLDRWLHEVIFPAEAAIVSPETVYWGTLLSCVEMLRNGITTFCDGYFFEDSAARAALDIGIRAVLGQGILDYPAPDLRNPARSRDRADDFLQSFPSGTNRLQPSLFCHAPYTCGAETLQWVKALCRKQDILFQIHLSETSAEVDGLVKKHGKSPVFYLDELGVLDDRTLCAHAVWLQPEEIELLALRRVNVSHNVESNMKLASGVAPIPHMLASGIKVGLGTDSTASNNDLDLFREMDRVAKLHKVFSRNPVVCSAPEVLRMATLGGASALGLSDRIGSLEVGKKADFIAIDLNQPHLTPLYDPTSHLVYTAKGSDVRHVWVDGRQIVSNGEITTADVSESIERVRQVASRIESGYSEWLVGSP